MTSRFPTVSMVPELQDRAGIASFEVIHSSPFYLFARDVWVLLTKLYLLPDVFRPFRTSTPTDELYLSGSGLLQQGWLLFMSIWSMCAMSIAFVIFPILPGALILIITLAGTAFVHILCIPLQGPFVTTTSSELLKTVYTVENHDRERWIFINGICVSGTSLQASVDQLSRIFHRKVIGIHNKTYGFVGDLTECIIQRSFGYYTRDTRYAYEYVKSFCADPAVGKVVLIGHSQGGIIVSSILDKLFTDLPSSDISKLEVYTFGNAASHFNNPLCESHRSQAHNPTTTTNGPSIHVTNPAASPSPDPDRVIPYIEHYANELDMVPRWGVLYSESHILNNRFCGKVFIHQGATGHFFNQHYLGPMFPLPGQHTSNGTANEGDGDADEEEAPVPFLDQRVDIDTDVEVERAAKLLKIKNQEAGSKYLPVQFGNGRSFADVDGAGTVGIDGDTGDVIGGGFQGTGKTVRELSRLWRYMGGRNPGEEL